MPRLKANYPTAQAEFQQKQLLEKERKLLQLYNQQQQRACQVVQRGSAGSNGSNKGSRVETTITATPTRTTTYMTTTTQQGGKVSGLARKYNNVAYRSVVFPREQTIRRARFESNSASGISVNALIDNGSSGSKLSYIVVVIIDYASYGE